MIRRTVLAIACAAALSGCATFTQDDVIASYNDVELDRDEFDARYVQVAGAAPTDGRLRGDTARGVVTNWILEQLLDEVGIVERYESGPAASGILCVALVRPDDLAAAERYVERLEQGEEWSNLVMNEFPEVLDGGKVNCLPTSELGDLAPQVAELGLDDPYGVFVFEDDTVAVLRMREMSEVDPIELAGIVQMVDPESMGDIGERFEVADITVDPQFGEFDPEAGGVVPLG